MIFSMKTKNTSLFLFALLIMSCTQKVKEERIEEIVADSSGIVVNDEHNAQNSLDYIGMYQGVVPCADCEGIETSLSLEDETNYVLKTNYLGKNKNSTNEVRGVYSWNEAGNTIILSGIVKAPNQYFVGENYLKQLDMDGNKIEGDLAEKYVLQKKSDSGEIPPPPPPPAPETIKNYSIHSKSLENISLVKNKWRLIELNGKSIESKEMFIKLNNEEGYIAFAGCNNMMGSVEFKDEKSLIKFTKVASTMMACPDMTTEQEFAEMLEKVDNYSLNGNSLSFNRARMATLARFEAMK
jgi:heat shock protein HslJ